MDIKSESKTKQRSNIKILSRGDILGAINCLFPELQMEKGIVIELNTHLKLPKLDENFSLFSDSQTNLLEGLSTANEHCEIENKLQINFMKAKSHLKNRLETAITQELLRTERCSEKGVQVSFALPEKNQKKEFCKSSNKQRIISKKKKQNKIEDGITRVKPLKEDYINFVNNTLQTNYPERYNDFKTIETIINVLENYDAIDNEKIKIDIPFNSNLPVLNISACQKVTPNQTETLRQDLIDKNIKSKKKKNRRRRKSKQYKNVDATNASAIESKGIACFDDLLKRTDSDELLDKMEVLIVENLNKILKDDEDNKYLSKKQIPDNFHLPIFQNSPNSNPTNFENVWQGNSNFLWPNQSSRIKAEITTTTTATTVLPVPNFNLCAIRSITELENEALIQYQSNTSSEEEETLAEETIDEESVEQKFIRLEREAEEQYHSSSSS